MGAVEQQQVYTEITKRLNESNIDRVALALSSNTYKNYFGMLTKYSCCIRIYFGQCVFWQVYHLLVTGLKTNDGFKGKIQTSARIASSHIRDVATGKVITWNEYHWKRRKTEEVKHYRKLAPYSKPVLLQSTALQKHDTCLTSRRP